MSCERARLLELFDQAVAGGAARYKVAELMEVSEHTLMRWRGADGMVAEGLRPDAERVEQPHKLTKAEELAILSACNQPQYGVYRPPRSCHRWPIKAFIWLRNHSTILA